MAFAYTNENPGLNILVSCLSLLTDTERRISSIIQGRDDACIKDDRSQTQQHFDVQMQWRVSIDNDLVAQ